MEILNIPLVNLRFEFLAFFRAFEKDEIEGIVNRNVKLLDDPSCLLRIHNKETLFTVILQRVILGFEAFYKAAVYEIFLLKGEDAKMLMRLKRDPKQFGKSYCEGAFVKIPGRLNDNYPMDTTNAALYEEVSEFYKDVRNQLLHGGQFHKIAVSEFRRILNMYKGVYDWLCGWVQAEYDAIGKTTGQPIPKNDIFRSLFSPDF